MMFCDTIQLILSVPPDIPYSCSFADLLLFYHGSRLKPDGSEHANVIDISSNADSRELVCLLTERITGVKNLDWYLDGVEVDRINSADPRDSGWASAVDVHEGYPIVILVRDEETTAREGVFTCRIDGGPPMASVGVYYPSENKLLPCTTVCHDCEVCCQNKDTYDDISNWRAEASQPKVYSRSPCR